MIIPSLKDYVYEYISGELQSGGLKSNDKINEQAICDTLNISRTPVREALIQLAADDLLEASPRRGFRVKSLTKKDAEDLYTIIGTLDALAAELSINYLTPKELDKMEQICHDIDQSIESLNFTKYYQLQKEFHDVYILKTKNEALFDTLNRLRNRFIRQNYINGAEEELKKVLLETNKEHKEIVELFRAKNINKLKDIIKQKHWSLTYAELDSLD